MGRLMDILSGAGAALDLPGSTLRDIAGGQNPFDQWMTPFSWDNRLTGRDLLRQYGAAGSEDTWGNYLAGTGIEMLSDLPAAALTGGLYSALKGGGKQALRSAAKPFEQTARQAAQRHGVMQVAPDASVAAAKQAAAAPSFTPNPKLPPAAQAYQQQMFQEGTDLLSRNTPRQWKSTDLVGPESIPEGQEAVRDALAQMAYSIGSQGAKKGKAARAKEFHKIREALLSEATPLQDKQHAALRLISEWGEEARLRRMAVESPGDYPLRNLRERFGYAGLLGAAGAGPLARSLRGERQPEEMQL
jgi:hypothetical protein